MTLGQRAKRLGLVLLISISAGGGFAAVPTAASASTYCNNEALTPAGYYPDPAADWSGTRTNSWLPNCTQQEGDYSSMVAAIQWIINTYPGPKNDFPCPVSVDGSFGTQTYNAVKCFQGNTGISADGMVGPETWNRLGLQVTVLSSDCDTSGWCYAYSHQKNGDTQQFREWYPSGKWYVYYKPASSWCEMNTSAPC